MRGPTSNRVVAHGQPVKRYCRQQNAASGQIVTESYKHQRPPQCRSIVSDLWVDSDPRYREAIVAVRYFTEETVAPSFIGVCSTSLRQAPRATAATTAARMIAVFIVFSPSVFKYGPSLTLDLLTSRFVGAKLHRLESDFLYSHPQSDRCERVLRRPAFCMLTRLTSAIARYGYRSRPMRSRLQGAIEGFWHTRGAKMQRLAVSAARCSKSAKMLVKHRRTEIVLLFVYHSNQERTDSVVGKQLLAYARKGDQAGSDPNDGVGTWRSL